MNRLTNRLAAAAAGATLATSAFAQTSEIVPVPNEPAPKLTVEAPLPGPLSRGSVLIPYHVEHLRVVPVLGAEATKVSPRVGHLHVTVDDLPWHWGDFSDNNHTIVVVGMPPGQHKVLVELADPEHHILAAQAVTFTVPGPAK